MGSNGSEHLKTPGNDAAECSETTVVIKIKTLDSQTYTLRVNKCVPVPELKEQIASVTGILSEQQRLICRGKVLKDDQLLSAYHVEDGHTLHLVVRQSVAPPADSSDHPATYPTSSTGQNPGSRISPSMVVGTFNMSEHGDGAFPDINQIISAVVNSFGVARFGSGGEGIDLNQPPSERPLPASGLGGTRSSSRQPDQPAPVATPVEPLQPPVIPDSLTTLRQYSSHLRQELSAYSGGQTTNARNAGFSGSDRETSVHSREPRRLLTPESLVEVMSSARRLLVEQANECLLQIAGQLESHSSVTDPVERCIIQSNAIRSGGLFQNLGALLLELGRAIMTLRMGQTPADALVNAGPSVFISSMGPNPIMVQPQPFQPGSSFGSVPVGTVQHGSGLGGGSTGTGFVPRNIDIRIRTGSVFSRRQPTGSPPQGQSGILSSIGVNSFQQDTAPVDPNPRNRETVARAIPLQTVIAAVPASTRRSSDSSHGSIGLLYPVLARVQHLSSGNSDGSRYSQESNHHRDPNGNAGQPIHDSTAQRQNVANPAGDGWSSLPSEANSDEGFSAPIRDGLEQLLSTIFPGGQIVTESTQPTGSGSSPSRTESAQDMGSSQQSASADLIEERVILSSILRQMMPMLSDNTRVEPNTPSSGGANSDEAQVDGNTDQGSSRRRRGSQSQSSSKRRRRE